MISTLTEIVRRCDTAAIEEALLLGQALRYERALRMAVAAGERWFGVSAPGFEGGAERFEIPLRAVMAGFCSERDQPKLSPLKLLRQLRTLDTVKDRITVANQFCFVPKEEDLKLLGESGASLVHFVRVGATALRGLMKGRI
jgi:hypothetical protein